MFTRATCHACFRYYYAWSDNKAHIGSSFDLASRLSRDVFPASRRHMALLSSGVACFPPHIQADPLARNRIVTIFQVLGGLQRIQDVVLALCSRGVGGASV